MFEACPSSRGWASLRCLKYYSSTSSYHIPDPMFWWIYCSTCLHSDTSPPSLLYIHRTKAHSTPRTFFYKPSGRTKDTLTFGWWGGHVHLKQTNSPSSSGVSSASRRTLGQTQKGFIDGKSLCFCSCTFPGNLVANKNGCNTKIIRCQWQKQEQRGLNPPCHGRL